MYVNTFFCDRCCCVLLLYARCGFVTPSGDSTNPVSTSPKLYHPLDERRRRLERSRQKTAPVFYNRIGRRIRLCFYFDNGRSRKVDDSMNQLRLESMLFLNSLSLSLSLSLSRSSSSLHVGRLPGFLCGFPCITVRRRKRSGFVRKSSFSSEKVREE